MLKEHHGTMTSRRAEPTHLYHRVYIDHRGYHQYRFISIAPHVLYYLFICSYMGLIFSENVVAESTQQPHGNKGRHYLEQPTTTTTDLSLDMQWELSQARDRLFLRTLVSYYPAWGGII